MIIHLGLFIIIQLFIWSKEIVLIWLGDEYIEAVPVIKLFLISLCPYLGYVMLRSIVDSIEEKAINTLNLLIAFGVTLVLSLALGFTRLGILGLASGITAGLTILGISTAYFLIKRYEISFQQVQLIWVLLINFIFGVITVFIKKYFILHFSRNIIPIAVIVAGTSLFVCYLTMLYMKNTRWVMEIKKRVLLVD